MSLQSHTYSAWSYPPQLQETAKAMVVSPTYREKLKEELRQELMSEVQAREPEQQPSLPQSLAGARSAGNRSSGPAWAGPAPLDELLK